MIISEQAQFVVILLFPLEIHPRLLGGKLTIQGILGYVTEYNLQALIIMGLSGSRKGYKQLNGHRFICTFDGANLFKRQRKQNLWPQARLSENY